MRRAALWNHWHMDWYGHFVSERFILISMAFKREAEQIYLLFTVSNNKLGSMKRSSKKRPQHEMISFFTLSSGFYPLWCLTSNNGEVVRWTSGECQVNVRWTERHLICSSQMQFPLKLFLSPCTAGLDDPEAVFTQVVEWMELCYGAVLSWGPDSHLDRPVYFCCEDDWDLCRHHCGGWPGHLVLSTSGSVT